MMKYIVAWSLKGQASLLTLVALSTFCASTFAQPATLETLSYECRVQYDASTELGFRTVQFLFKSKKMVQVNLDGQPAYTFHRSGSKVAVSVDSERIQIEFQKNKVLWHSNIRDRYFGEGVCVVMPETQNQ